MSRTKHLDETILGAEIKHVINSTNRQPVVSGSWPGLYDLYYKYKNRGEFGGGKSSGSGYSGIWGDVDYIRNTPVPAEVISFSEAFARARQEGKETFRFNGKLYTTEVDPNYKKGKAEYEIITPPLNIREILDKQGNIIDDSTRIEPYVGQPVGYIERETRKGKSRHIYIGADPFKRSLKNGGTLN